MKYISNHIAFIQKFCTVIYLKYIYPIACKSKIFM
jgi:hypothetical protein